MSSSIQDVSWSSGEPEVMPITRSPIALATVISVLEEFGYKLDDQWPQRPILNFEKTGEPPITIAQPDFRSAADGRPCYDRDMVYDMLDRVLTKAEVDGGITLRMALKRVLKN